MQVDRIRVSHRGSGSLVLMHGSRKLFSSFAGAAAPARSVEQLKFGVHFTDDPLLACHYSGPRGYVYFCRVSWKKIFDADRIFPPPWSGTMPEEASILAPAIRSWARGRPPGTAEEFFENGAPGSLIDVLPPKKAFELLSAAGFDAVAYTAILSSGGRIHRRSRAIVVLEAEQAGIIAASEARRFCAPAAGGAGR